MESVFALLTRTLDEHGGDVRRALGTLRSVPVWTLAAPLLTSFALRAVAGQPASATSDRSDVQVVIATADRMLFVVQGIDTVFQAPIGVGTGLTFAYGDRTWRFRMPPGEWRVLRKTTDPVWVPPDWHYAETARNHGLKLVRLAPSGITLRSGARLEIRANAIGITVPGGEFAELPRDEHIVFEGRLFIPPLGTLNRRIAGNLGRFALDLGHGYLIHGTTNQASIGEASTHGCIRVHDDDLLWLFDNVPVGTRVVVR